MSLCIVIPLLVNRRSDGLEPGLRYRPLSYENHDLLNLPIFKTGLVILHGQKGVGLGQSLHSVVQFYLRGEAPCLIVDVLGSVV